MTETLRIKGRPLDAWIECLHDLDRATRVEAIRTLGRAGESLRGTTASRALLPAIHDSDLEYAGLALWALAKIGDPVAVEPIIARLSTSPRLEYEQHMLMFSGLVPWEDQTKNGDSFMPFREDHMFLYGISALSRAGDQRAIPFLRAIAARQSHVRNLADEALARLGTEPVRYVSPNARTGCVSLAALVFLITGGLVGCCARSRVGVVSNTASSQTSQAG